jgi:hypothetical protein
MQPVSETRLVTTAPHLEAIAERRKEVISCNIAEETVLLDVHSGVYYGLDPVATIIWTLLSGPKSIRQLRDELMKEYEVDSSTCAASVLRFIALMSKKGLITVVENDATGA